MIDYNIKALQNLVPNCKLYWVGTDWDGLQWEDERPQPTKEAWEAEKARLIAYQPKQDCKDEAKRRIALTDWSVLPDRSVMLENASDFVTYRTELLNLILNPVDSPIWPTEPKARWK